MPWNSRLEKLVMTLKTNRMSAIRCRTPSKSMWKSSKIFSPTGIMKMTVQTGMMGAKVHLSSARQNSTRLRILNSPLTSKTNRKLRQIGRILIAVQAKTISLHNISCKIYLKHRSSTKAKLEPRLSKSIRKMEYAYWKSSSFHKKPNGMKEINPIHAKSLNRSKFRMSTMSLKTCLSPR